MGFQYPEGWEVEAEKQAVEAIAAREGFTILPCPIALAGSTSWNWNHGQCPRRKRQYEALVRAAREAEEVRVAAWIESIMRRPVLTLDEYHARMRETHPGYTPYRKPAKPKPPVIEYVMYEGRRLPLVRAQGAVAVKKVNAKDAEIAALKAEVARLTALLAGEVAA